MHFCSSLHDGTMCCLTRPGKNDAANASAICEAVQGPNMHLVPIKDGVQQAQLTLHRMRHGFIEQRTATSNRIRGCSARSDLLQTSRCMKLFGRREGS
jgi:transposase